MRYYLVCSQMTNVANVLCTMHMPGHGVCVCVCVCVCVFFDKLFCILSQIMEEVHTLFVFAVLDCC